MKSTVTAVLAALALALGLAGCAITPDADPKIIAQQRVDQITIAYNVVHTAAILCTSGVVCKDEGVIKAVATALPIADLAVSEATRLILANVTDQSAVSKYAAIALSAIDVLAKALQSYGVKI